MLWKTPRGDDQAICFIVYLFINKFFEHFPGRGVTALFQTSLPLRYPLYAPMTMFLFQPKIISCDVKLSLKRWKLISFFLCRQALTAKRKRTRVVWAELRVETFLAVAASMSRHSTRQGRKKSSKMCQKNIR